MQANCNPRPKEWAKINASKFCRDAGITRPVLYRFWRGQDTLRGNYEKIIRTAERYGVKINGHDDQDQNR